MNTKGNYFNNGNQEFENCNGPFTKSKGARTISEYCYSINHDHRYSDTAETSNVALKKSQAALKTSRALVKTLSQRVKRLRNSVSSLKKKVTNRRRLPEASDHEMALNEEEVYLPTLPLKSEMDGEIKEESGSGDLNRPTSLVYAEPLFLQDVKTEGHQISTTRRKSEKLCRVCLLPAPETALPEALNDSYWIFCGVQKETNMADIALCAICRRLLQKAHRFREQCRKAHVFIERCVNGEQPTTANLTEEQRESFRQQSNRSTNQNILEFGNTEVKQETSDCDNGPDPACYEYCDVDHIQSDDDKASVDTKLEGKTNKMVSDKLRSRRKKTSQRKKSTDSKKLEIKYAFNRKVFKEYIVVRYLSFEEQRNALLEKRESMAYKRASYKCNMCYKIFCVESSYNTHAHKHSEESGKFTCSICQLHLSSKYYLTRHMKTHMFLFICKKCPFKSQFRDTAMNHATSHCGKLYECKLCSITFKHRTTYFNHMRRIHPSTHLCQLCGLSFISENGLLSHNARTHRLDKRTIPSDGPLCAQCNTRFIDEAAFRKHKEVSSCANKDGESKPRKRSETTKKCKKCDKEFLYYALFKQHMLLDHPNECAQKEKKIYPKEKIEILCDICGKIFSSKYTLKSHLVIHDGQPRKEFKCEECGRNYKSMETLSLHKKKHAGVTYICGICGKVFTDNTNKRRHIKYVHSDVRSVKCAYCDKTFKSKDCKNAHESHVHLKVPYRQRVRKRHDDSSRKQLEGLDKLQSKC